MRFVPAGGSGTRRMSTSFRNRRAVRFEIPSSCDRDALSCGSITWKIRAELGEPEDSPAVSSSSSANGSFVLVLVSSAASQTSTSPTTILLNSSDAKTVQTVAEGLKARLGAKGGGKGTRWSGKWLGVWKEGKEGSVVKEILDGVKLEQVSVA